VKYLISLALIIVSAGCLFARTTVDFGPKLGFNLSQHYGTKAADNDLEVQSVMRPGISAGAWLDLNILPNFSLGYELLYSMKGSEQNITIIRMEEDGEMVELDKPAVMNVKYYLDYLEVPILLKVKTLDRPGWSISAITGTAMGIKVKGWHRLDGTFYLPLGDGEFDAIPVTEESRLEEVNLFDFSFVYGGNLELKGKVPLILEYRFTLGWDNLALPTFELFEPVQLRNQTYSLMLGYKF